MSSDTSLPIQPHDDGTKQDLYAYYAYKAVREAVTEFYEQAYGTKPNSLPLPNDLWSTFLSIQAEHADSDSEGYSTDYESDGGDEDSLFNFVSTAELLQSTLEAVQPPRNKDHANSDGKQAATLPLDAKVASQACAFLRDILKSTKWLGGENIQNLTCHIITDSATPHTCRLNGLCNDQKWSGAYTLCKGSCLNDIVDAWYVRQNIINQKSTEGSLYESVKGQSMTHLSEAQWHQIEKSGILNAALSKSVKRASRASRKTANFSVTRLEADVARLPAEDGVTIRISLFKPGTLRASQEVPGRQLLKDATINLQIPDDQSAQISMTHGWPEAEPLLSDSWLKQVPEEPILNAGWHGWHSTEDVETGVASPPSDDGLQ